MRHYRGNTRGNMKHEIYRFQPVIARGKCVGHVLRTFKGFKAFNAADRIVGEYPEAEQALNQLRRLAALAST